MDIVMMNGTPGAYTGGMDAYVDELCSMLGEAGHTVHGFQLRDMNLKYCTGCFGCWLKTPGLCLIKDDAEVICRTFVHADLVIMASPVLMGFTSAVLKRAQDRIIPLALPYIEAFGGELHHPRRYSRIPLMALLLEKADDADDEDLAIIRCTYDRMAINAHTKVAMNFITSRPAWEVCHEINSI